MAVAPWAKDLLTLELLLDVAELGSVGKAAAVHGLSQPAASARLSRLERQTGLALLARSVTGSELTATGQTFAGWAREVVLGAQRLGDTVESLRATASARLRLAASLTVAEYLMPEWLLALRRRHPDLVVTAEVANSHEVCDRVRSGQVDLGLVELPTPPADLTSRPVGVDRLILVAAPGHPALRRAHPFTAADLLDQSLLLREVGSGTRETFLGALGRALGPAHDVVPAHAVELGSTATILATARAGGGIGVLSARAARADLEHGSLAVVPTTGLDVTRPLTAVWSGSQPTPATRELLDVVDDTRRPTSGPAAHQHR